MIHWKRTIWLGFLSWLIPLAVSFLLFPLRARNAPLFHGLLSFTGLLAGGTLFQRYFRDRPITVREAVTVGLLWLAVNLALDYPMFSHGPMQMTMGAYYSEIGVAYLGIPTFAFCAARLARS